MCSSSLKDTLRAVLLERLGRDLFSQGNLQMTLLRKVLNHIFAFVRESEENNDTDLPHPAFAIELNFLCLIRLQDN